MSAWAPPCVRPCNTSYIRHGIRFPRNTYLVLVNIFTCHTHIALLIKPRATLAFPHSLPEAKRNSSLQQIVSEIAEPTSTQRASENRAFMQVPLQLTSDMTCHAHNMRGPCVLARCDLGCAWSWLRWVIGYALGHTIAGMVGRLAVLRQRRSIRNPLLVRLTVVTEASAEWESCRTGLHTANYAAFCAAYPENSPGPRALGHHPRFEAGVCRRNSASVECRGAHGGVCLAG